MSCPEVSDKWRDVLMGVPGFDPFRESAGAFFDPEIATRALMFFPECLTHVEGEVSGLPFNLEPWQKSVIANLFGWQKTDSYGRKVRRFREMFLLVPRKNGKALALDTPIPTPDGWTPMGDLLPGDSVFSDTGDQCIVTEAHAVMHGHRCYRVTFSDGTSIVADADHLWTVKDRFRCKDGGWVTITTDAIAQRVTCGHRETHKERRYSVPSMAPLMADDATLMVDPYVLGAWLGDGDSDCARITMGDADADESCDLIRQRGYSVGKRKGPACKAGRYRIAGLQSDLRRMCLLKNKHIPSDYLRASDHQRMELLRGLMDTDGSISKRGQCEFVTVKRVIYDGFIELARSVGIKATSKIDRARVNGKDCGPRYRVQFFTSPDRQVFKLKRKAARVYGRASASRSKTRQIVSVEEVPSVPVRCIRVDSPSSLFLAGPGMVATHNTPFAAGICLYGLFCDGEAGAQIYSAAADKDQAAILYRHASGMILNEPELSNRAKIYRALKSIERKDDKASVYRVLSSDAHTKHGGNSHLILVDELHAQPNRDLVDVLMTSMASQGRKQPLIVFITTADFMRPSICNEKYDYACKVRDGIIPDQSFLPVIYEAGAKDDWTSEETWKKANPNLGVSVSIDYLRRECARAKETPAFENTFKRLHLNIRTQNDCRWISMEKWNGSDSATEDLTGRECFAGLDLASVSDLAALILLFPAEDGHFDCLARFWCPAEGAAQRTRRDRVPYEQWIKDGWIKATEGNVTDYDVIREDIRLLSEQFSIREIAVDRWNATQITTQLGGDGFEMVPFGQGFGSMSAPSKELEKIIIGKLLRHGNNPVLNWMASNVTIEQDAAGNIKPSKKKSTEKIDGIVALVMALGRAISTSPEVTSERICSVL